VENNWRGHIGTRKTKRRDVMYLPAGLAKQLGRPWQLTQTESNAAQIASGLVFPSRTGKLARQRLRTALDWCHENYDIPRLVPHDLRHTAVTLWNEVAHPTVAQRAIGHSDAKMHAHYHHPYESAYQEGSNAVADLIGLTAWKSAHPGAHPSRFPSEGEIREVAKTTDYRLSLRPERA